MMWRSRRQGLHDESLLATLGKRLRTWAASIAPRDEFRSSLRAFLMMEASTALAPDPTRPTAQASPAATRMQPRRRMVLATAFIATTLGMGGVTSASASALPGEALYPVKRATEQVELALHRDLADRGAFQLELAERRLHEARQLSQEGPGSAELAAETVREFEETAAAGTADLLAAFREDRSRTSIVVLNRFTERTDELLETLESQLPAQESEALTDARDRLAAIDNRADEVCPGCGDGGGESPPSPTEPDGSTSLPPEPDPEPEPEPEPPADSPAPPVSIAPDPAPADSESQDDSDDESEEDSDEESEPEPAEPAPPMPTPTPTPPQPAPEPTPTPEPTPEPTPGLPPVLEIVPDTVEGVGEVLGATLNVLL